MSWLVFVNKLRTRSWLYCHGLIDDDGCPFCMGVEDINHLFFEFIFVKSLIAGVLEKLQLKSKAATFEQWWQWNLRVSKEKKGEAIVRKRLLAAIIYEICSCRNKRVFQMKGVQVQQAVESVWMVLKSDRRII